MISVVDTGDVLLKNKEQAQKAHVVNQLIKED
jgi:hypothetical protein